MLDSHTSRIAQSQQRQRDGAFQEREARLRGREMQLGVTQEEVARIRESSLSPRAAPDEAKAFGMRKKAPPGFSNEPLKWSTPTDYTTTTNSFYPKPMPQAPGSPRLSPRATRYGQVMSRRVTPAIYASVFCREPNEPADSPRAMPPQARVATRGGVPIAGVPTAGYWVNGPITLPAISSPRARDSEREYRARLLEAQIRSEKRIAEAARATTIAMEAERRAGCSNVS
jgi:hypothetical protein